VFELGSKMRPLLATTLACCLTCAGSKSLTWSNKCAIDECFGTGKHKVEGRFSPLKVVNSTLTVAMFGFPGLDKHMIGVPVWPSLWLLDEVASVQNDQERQEWERQFH